VTIHGDIIDYEIIDWIWESSRSRTSKTRW